MNKINRLQLRSEKLEQHQYDLDNLLKDLEKKEYIDYYNDIKNIKTYESQARILDELPISIKPPDVVNLVLGVEKKAWAVNNYLDYYSHKQKWVSNLISHIHNKLLLIIFIILDVSTKIIYIITIKASYT